MFFWKKNKPAAILFVLILAQCILISLQVPLGDESSLFKKIITAIFSPVKHGVVFVDRGIGAFWNNYFSFRDSRLDNKQLNMEILTLRQENLFLKNTLKKYFNEKTIREKVLEFHSDFFIANIVGVDLNNYYKTIIINRGTLDRVRKNMIVLDRNGYLVGRVLEPLSFKESRVQLITDDDIGLGVFTETGAPFGILAGDGNGQCQLKYILKTNLDIQFGQDVFTSGQDGVFPRNIPVGRIVRVEEVDSMFKVVRVKPFFQFKDLDHLVVLRRDLKEDY